MWSRGAEGRSAGTCTLQGCAGVRALARSSSQYARREARHPTDGACPTAQICSHKLLSEATLLGENLILDLERRIAFCVGK